MTNRPVLGRPDAGPAPRGAPVPALKVLVVEDLPRVQTMLCELLEDPGRVEVCGVADDETGALKLFDRHRPQVVLVDLSLRRGTGLGVLQGIRSHAAGGSVLLIVLTNHTMPALRAACERAGADHFLDKSREFLLVRRLVEERAGRAGH